MNKTFVMTDEELQVRVAKLLGWRWVVDRWVAPGENEKIVLATALRHERDLPNWPTEIAAAWKLVEANPDWRWSVYELDNGEWAAAPMKVIGTRGE